MVDMIDNTETLHWTRADSEDALHAILDQVQPRDTITYTAHIGEHHAVFSGDARVEGKAVSLAFESLPVRDDAGYIRTGIETFTATVAKQAEPTPAWVTECRAVVDRDGDVWQRNGSRWSFASGIRYDWSDIPGPVRPLLRNDGTTILSEDEIDATALMIARGVTTYWDGKGDTDVRRHSVMHRRVLAALTNRHTLNGGEGK